MAIPNEIKETLLNIKSRLPEDRQPIFARAIASRTNELQGENLIKYTVLGGAFGALFEALPGFETISGIDDCVEVGAALGAWVGLAKDFQARQERQRIKTLIEECLNEAMAK